MTEEQDVARMTAESIAEHARAHPNNVVICPACQARLDYWVACLLWGEAPAPKKGWRHILRRLGMVAQIRTEGAKLVDSARRASR